MALVDRPAFGGCNRAWEEDPHVVSDDSVAPKDRIKAAEVVLDRVGINGTHDREPSVAISVDIDFDDRLARIVAGSQG